MRRVNWRIWLCLFLLASVCAAAEDRIEFNRDVRPILAGKCFACHGPDAGKRQAELRLDDREAAIWAGAIDPGKLESALLARISSSDPQMQMPPPDSKKTLTAEQKETLRKWILQGAEYQKHWAYEPPRKADIPANQSAIDYLVSQRLRKVGLAPSTQADRRTLIRRLYSDLVGLVPSAAEVEAFEKDESPRAYEELVEKLMASPHYGERMAIGWLDVVRFADTIGYHSDNPRNVWPYRDWVINSFNANKRFDRFTIEQIAGDLLPDANTETRVGSAFNRLLLSTEEGGAQPADYEARMLTDRVRAIGAAWLGQTTGCAQCHDHKFDPFTARDFYSLGAFFADIKEQSVGHREDGMPVPGPEEQKRLDALEAEIAVATAAGEAQLAKLQELQKERGVLVKAMPKCLVSSVASSPRTVRISPKGNWMDESGEVVAPRVPHYLPQSGLPADRKLNRLDLAQWLVSRDNPLTARTVVNRLWKQFFGAGLSRVLADLGAQGEAPSNPELLDCLACEFMDSQWDVKHVVRTIVLSKTYRQVSTAKPELIARDPENREWTRQTAFRVDAELVRDYALQVSGLLSPKIGGPSVKPYQPEGYWENLNFPPREYAADSGDAQHRRGLYIWWQRTFLHPSLLAFDAPSREECCAERPRSNIPQQALVLLNDPTYVEASRAFAKRILLEGGETTEQRLAWAWRTALQRAPDEMEVKTLKQLLEKQLIAARRDSTDGESGVELAAWTHVARVILNLHEMFTRS